jgi:hypothetical protein
VRPMNFPLSAVLVLACGGAAAGCGSIPKEAPTLSAELGQRVGALESVHIALLRAYFDEKRERIDEFVTKEWVPAFAQEVMQTEPIKSVWLEVTKSTTSDADRLQFMTRLGPALQTRIEAKRRELIAPLDELSTLIERRLRDDYQQARAINTAITGLLLSASEVEENRNRLLEKAGVKNADVLAALDEADSAVSKLVGLRDTAADKLKDLESFKASIDRAIAKMRTTKGETNAN